MVYGEMLIFMIILNFLKFMFTSWRTHGPACTL